MKNLKIESAKNSGHYQEFCRHLLCSLPAEEMGNFWTIPADIVEYTVFDYPNEVIIAIAPDGTTYARTFYNWQFTGETRVMGNFWTIPVSTEQSTWGGIKKQ